MSNYNEETGNLTFTKTGYQAVMSAFRKGFNDYIDSVFTISASMHNLLKLKAVSVLKAAKKKLMNCSTNSVDINQA